MRRTTRPTDPPIIAINGIKASPAAHAPRGAPNNSQEPPQPELKISVQAQSAHALGASYEEPKTSHHPHVSLSSAIPKPTHEARSTPKSNTITGRTSGTRSTGHGNTLAVAPPVGPVRDRKDSLEHVEHIERIRRSSISRPAAFWRGYSDFGGLPTGPPSWVGPDEVF